jgi:hypothetical protein
LVWKRLMFLPVEIRSGRYRLLTVRWWIIGIEKDTSERFGRRAGNVRWTPVWRPGRRIGARLLSVVATARAPLPGLTLADEAAMKSIRWMVDVWQTEVPSWVWPKPPRPPRPRRRLWLKAAEKAARVITSAPTCATTRTLAPTDPWESR